MKRMFNIKRIGLMIFTFLCIFFATKNVDAAGKYVCYYVEPKLDTKLYTWEDSSTNFVSNATTTQLYIQLTYENGKASFKYYDADTKTTHTTLTETHTSMGDFAISSKSGSQLTDADFANGCPIELSRMSYYPGIDGDLYDVFKVGTEEYKNFNEVTLKDSIYATSTIESIRNFAKYKPGKDMFCYSADNVDGYGPLDFPRGICDKIPGEELPETTDAAVTEGNILSCLYSNESVVIDEGKTKTHITLKINLAENTIISSNSIAKNSKKVKTAFTASQVNGECPKEVYTNDSNRNTIYLNKKDVPKGEDATKYSLIKFLSKQDVPLGQTGCEALGGLVKYLKIAYTLLRYLIPVIIIIFSVIDFLGVVLSGENEKMEKAKKRFMTRLIVGFVVLIVPFILELLLKLVGIINSNQSLVDAACNIF